MSKEKRIHKPQRLKKSLHWRESRKRRQAMIMKGDWQNRLLWTQA